MGRRSGGLTQKQHQVLAFIVKTVEERGLPPTIREIGNQLGTNSTWGVRRYLQALERKGFIKRHEGQARGIELVREQVRKLFLGPRHIPLVGRVAAGEPVLAVENIEGLLSLEELFPAGENFALRIQGESMKEAGILHGDIVIVRQQPTAEVGEIVVAIVNGEEATVKELAQLKGRLYLKPANPRYEPIPAEGAQIVGKVVGVIRKLR